MRRLHALTAIVCAGILFVSGSIPFGIFPVQANAAETYLEQEASVPVESIQTEDVEIEVAETLDELQEYAPADLETDSLHSSDFSSDKTEDLAVYVRHRIIVYTDDELKDTFGATDASYYTKDGGYRLCYDSDEATKAAYEALNSIYGADSVILDMPISISIEDNAPARAAKGWGASYMHLDHFGENNEKEDTGEPVTIAVLDTGIVKGHEVFAGKTISNDSISLIDDNVEDENGHGTAVSGIIAESTSNNVDLLIVKIANASGESSLDYMMTGLSYALEKGADVANVSLNAYYGDTSLSDSRIQGDIAAMDEKLQILKDEGLLICTSAGNDARDIQSVYNYPAMSENVLCVGSIDAQEEQSSFSSYGAALDFTAPGESIQCAWKDGSDSWKSLSGTSMATPYISAACAIIKSTEPNLAFTQVEEQLAGLAKDLGDAGKDEKFGYGVPIFNDYPTDVNGTGTDSGVTNKSSDIQKSSEDTEKSATLVDGITLPEGWEADDPGSYKAYEQMYGDVQEEQIFSDLKDVLLKTSDTTAITKWKYYNSNTYANFWHDSMNTDGKNLIPIIDVSYHNGTINWSKVKASGVQGVMIRCGRRTWGSAGTIGPDTKFLENIKGAKAAGLKVGVYFFSQAVNTTEAVEEAKYSIEQVEKSGVKLDLPVTIDVEYSDGGSGRLYNAHLSKAAQTNVASAFCEYVKSKGYTPMVYASSSFLVGNMDGKALSNKGYMIWMARYRYAAYSSSSIFYSNPVNMWQCTSQAAVDGINTAVDLNYWYGYFSDVTNPNDFWYTPVNWAASEGITTGWSDGTFRPWNTCNRAAVVTFLWRLAEKPAAKGTDVFTDMTGNSDFDRAISWAAGEGITTGWSDGTFRPWVTCNRAAIVTFLWRYAGEPEVESIASFKDMPSNTADNQDFRKAISWAAEKGITTGWDDNTFRPWNNCNRAAIVTFLYRYVDVVQKEEEQKQKEAEEQRIKEEQEQKEKEQQEQEQKEVQEQAQNQEQDQETELTE